MADRAPPKGRARVARPAGAETYIIGAPRDRYASASDAISAFTRSISRRYAPSSYKPSMNPRINTANVATMNNLVQKRADPTIHGRACRRSRTAVHRDGRRGDHPSVWSREIMFPARRPRPL